MDPADIATDTSDLATPTVVDPAVDGTEAVNEGDDDTDTAPKPDASRGEPRFTVVDAAGEALDADWPEGAKLRFWDSVRADIGAAIPEHEYLTEDDLDEVMDRFFRGYDTHRMELVGRYRAEAARRGIPAERATEQAERDAVTPVRGSYPPASRRARSRAVLTRVFDGIR
jgi:hypothetical protein